ncbi:MAG TPA: hypothetical protein VD813_09420 [Pseudonocardia sp.]|nr:hypothetical protein [Pseudonocardia sp.]
MTGTDDERLAALLREAGSTIDASGVPPSRFDHADVVAASRRITVRRRSALVGGVLALVVVSGIGAAAVLPGGGGDDGTAATASAPAAGPEAAPGDAGTSGPARADSSEVPPFTGAPLGPGEGECADRQDPALRGYLEQVLPEVTGAPEALVTMECRPGGERGVNLEVDDAGLRGVLVVEYLPPGTPAREPVPGTAWASAPTASGGTVVVTSQSVEPDGQPPFGGRLDAVATFLAPRR